MKRRLLAVAASALATVLLAAFAINAAGSNTSRIALADRTLVVSLEKSSDSSVDAKPKGPSSGDTWQGAGNISENGARVGRVQLTTTLVDAKYHSGFQTGVLIFADGIVTYQGTGIGKPIPGIPLDPDVNVYAITGGTGAYEGTGGTIALKSLPGKSIRATATLHFKG
jgi:hypothetical protein